MRIRNLAVATIAIMSMTACSKDKTATTSAVGGAFQAVGTSLSGLNGMIPNTDGSHGLSRTASNAGVVTPNNIWDGTVWMPDPRCSGGSDDPHCSTGDVTLKGYMGFMFDEDQVRDNGSDINVFGRVKSALKHGCAISTLLGDSKLPDAGTYSLTFDSSAKSSLETYCYFTDTDLGDLDGATLSVTVTDTTDTTYYDRKAVMVSDDTTMTFFLRVDSTTVHFLTSEVSGTDNRSRMVLSLDRSTGKLLAEYASASSSGNGSGEWHRLFYDPANSDGSVVGSSFDLPASGADQMVYAIHGSPGDDTKDLAYSIGIQGFGLTGVDSGASTTGLNYYKTCVNASTGASTTDNTVTCGTITGHDVSSGGLATVFNTLTTALGTAGVNKDNLVSATVISETTTTPFTTDSDIFTAAVPISP